jgi:hypothetical protein
VLALLLVLVLVWVFGLLWLRARVKLLFSFKTSLAGHLKFREGQIPYKIITFGLTCFGFARVLDRQRQTRSFAVAARIWGCEGILAPNPGFHC